MKVHLIRGSVITILSCCAVTILGGWIDNRPSSPLALKGSHVRQHGTADSSKQNYQWDSTGWTGRVVVGEYTTGVNCQICREHDLAFDTVMAHYPSKVFIPLEYHYSGNVPISNPDDRTQKRWYAWWGQPSYTPKEDQDGVIPHASKDSSGYFDWGNYIDGHATKGCSGFGCGDEQVKNMQAAINADLHKAPEAELHVEAIPKGGTIVAKVQVTSLSKSHSGVYLRLVVIEDTVLLKVGDTAEFNKRGAYYKRLNFYNVVRAAAQEAKHPFGILMHGAGTVSYTFDMAKTQEQRLHYRSIALGKPRPKLAFDSIWVNQFKLTHSAAFTGKEGWVMDPKRLHVVAFVQDVHTGDVLQARIVHVNTGPHGELLKLP